VVEQRKVCIVTGSSSGIGAATVKLYAKQGWNVVVNYSREAAPAETVAAECRKLGADVLVARADIASDADCRRQRDCSQRGRTASDDRHRRSSHPWRAGNVPQDPPQPSLPQLLPEQFGVQLPLPIFSLILSNPRSNSETT